MKGIINDRLLFKLQRKYIFKPIKFDNMIKSYKDLT